MALSAYQGSSQALDGRAAGSEAAIQAVEKIGRSPILIGFVIASHSLFLQQVLAGVAAQVGDAPLLGYSSLAELTKEGVHQRSVQVILLVGSDVAVKADWWAGYADESRKCCEEVLEGLQVVPDNGILLAVADGLSGKPDVLCDCLSNYRVGAAGWLSGAELRHPRTFQAGGRQAGSEGLGAAYLQGQVVMGVGCDHGWQPTGRFFEVTRSKGNFIRTLDGLPVSEALSQLFGYSPLAWTQPPLNELVRLYPFGMEDSKDKAMKIFAPIIMQSDGSLRMHLEVPQKSIFHLMIGSVSQFGQAVERATAQALRNLKGARPVMGLLLPDISWRLLLDTQPGIEMQSMQSILGKEMPYIGGYTFGQLAPTLDQERQENWLQFHSGEVVVIILGESL
jgi:hypothetical protein